MVLKTFETDTYIMKVHDNALVEFLIKENVEFKESDIWLSKQQCYECLPHAKFYVLLESEARLKISADAKLAAASEKYGEHVAALALCSSNLEHKIFGNIYLKYHKPFVLTRFFDDRETALFWLNSKMG